MNAAGLQRVHLIFKTHLDVGFTDFAANIVQHYFDHYIPAAIDLARSQRVQYGRPTFIWTTGSWLIYEYLEQATPAARKAMEDAILAGDIAWHALPFTVHSENMRPSLFRFGLSLSQQLDHRFGRQTIAAKMTDVPGHTRAIVPLLAEAGVQFLHIGVNPASTPPAVPPVFVWRDPSGAEVMVMYHKGSYGETMLVPGLAEAIAFAHTNDNLGPQDETQLAAIYRQMAKEFPQAQVIPSTLDAFAASLGSIRAQLPVIKNEMGDTWIHGIGTDPAKESRYRELSRLRDEWLARGVSAEALRDFSRKLLLVPEHTWGLDIKTHLRDFDTYSAADFQAHRTGANFRQVEASWEEQRAYIDQAVTSLPVELRDEADIRQARLVPTRPDTRTYYQIDPTQPVRTSHYTLRFDPSNGALISFRPFGLRHDWASPKNPLARFWYQGFSANDYQRFYRQYLQNLSHTREWAYPDFGKPGMEDTASSSFQAEPSLTWAGVRETDESSSYLLLLAMPAQSWTDYGTPPTLSLEYTFSTTGPGVDITLQWFDKPACRLPEALWLSFVPRIRHPRAWRLHKLGQWISPYDVIRDGNRHLHGVQQGARYDDGQLTLSIETLDTALLAPGKPSMLNFNNRQPNLRRGLHANLFNNVWGTNFPMWTEGDARFRFRLS
jgi:hypothetical protein